MANDQAFCSLYVLCTLTSLFLHMFCFVFFFCVSVLSFWSLTTLWDCEHDMCCTFLLQCHRLLMAHRHEKYAYQMATVMRKKSTVDMHTKAHSRYERHTQNENNRQYRRSDHKLWANWHIMLPIVLQILNYWNLCVYSLVTWLPSNVGTIAKFWLWNVKWPWAGWLCRYVHYRYVFNFIFL